MVFDKLPPPPTCLHEGCIRDATMWALSVSTHYPTFCLEHAPKRLALQDEDEDEDVDTLRSKLRAAEMVCYRAEAMLNDTAYNLDIRIPELRSALRAWKRLARSV